MIPDDGERSVVEYTVTFRVPEERVEAIDGGRTGTAIRRAATEMVLRLTDQYCYDFQFDADDPYSVTVKVEREDDPQKPHAEERIGEILTVMSRMLGQRCLDRKHGEEVRVELHSDKAALELLVENNRGTMVDREGQIIGYLY